MDYTPFQQYYAGRAYPFWEPKDLSRRHIRGKNREGKWVKCTRTISNAQKLKEWVLKKEIVDLYLSTVSWLSPVRMGPKIPREGYVVADRLPIKNYIVIDLDADIQDLEHLERCKEETKKVLDTLKEMHGVKLQYILFTGCKGFQISYEDLAGLPERAQDRLEYFHKRKCFIQRILSELNVDAPVITDVMRVTRYPGSVNSKTGLVSRFIGREELDGPYSSIAALSTCIYTFRPAIPAQAVEMTDPRRLKSSLDNRPGLRLPDTRFYILNKVTGTKTRFVPMLAYNLGDSQPEQYALEDYKALSRKYKLGRALIMIDKWNSRVYLTSVKVFPREQLEKIYNASRAVNKTSFIKYGRSFMLWPSHVVEVLSERVEYPEARSFTKLYGMKGHGETGTENVRYRIVEMKNKESQT